MKIASWNIEGRLSDFGQRRRGQPAQVLREIEKLDADILWLPEAHNQNGFAPDVTEKIAQLGYNLTSLNYHQNAPQSINDKVSNTYGAFLSREKAESQNIIRLANYRDGIKAVIGGVAIFGVHLDDREEEMRIAMVNDLVEMIDPRQPTVIMGDLNAMHAHDRKAQMFRSQALERMEKILPSGRVRYLVERIRKMAIGTTLAKLEQSNLRDADPKMHATVTPKQIGFEFLPSIRMAQIDHILVSPEIQYTNFKVARDGGADHRAVSVEILGY